jgi:hypothetical protein
VKGKPAVLPDRAIRRQSHYFIYRPRIILWYLVQRGPGSVVGITTSYGLDGPGIES